MFYSHEILTSPEHGVATIWLVATLGSKSITRRLNRKTILDVDVPKACNVIMDPHAPMALRLQGNLLYGVSRVYSQQCGYTLTDVQSMHDRMKTMLRIVPGGALDPMAGKTRPDQLIIPYDPSFTPETDLPGLDINLSKLTLFAEPLATTMSPWPASPDLSQSALSNASLQLSFGSEDMAMADNVASGSEPDLASPVRLHLAHLAISALHDNEEGVLLQPDFDFDEDGNIIELGHPSEHRTSPRRFETPLVDEMDELALDYHEPPNDIQTTPTPHPHPVNTPPADTLPIATTNDRSSTQRPKGKKQAPLVALDEQTTLRYSELARMNAEYIQNMATALQQQKRSALPSQAKKNAAFWVFGRGIADVGVGVGVTHAAHPLGEFSGRELAGLLDPARKRSRRRGSKRAHAEASDMDTDSESAGRRVRAREDELEAQIGRGEDGPGTNNFWNEDIELARHASSALRDDNSSLMPWNITASVQSSATNPFRGLGSSSRSVVDSAAAAAFGRVRSRLTSASPLAGRGFPYDVEGLESLATGGLGDNMDIDAGDFDLNQYLQTEVAGQDAAESAAAAGKRLSALEEKLERATLDQDSQNFLHFLVEKLPLDEYEDPFAGHGLSQSKETSFWDLLPPMETSRAVATNGLMHVLALATKGFLMVRQEEYEDVSNENGVRYEFGEIFVRLGEA
ncbi:Rec8 like protein-domain-containing protein [Aspergillus ambiguus]|uniref:Rad21/Rec8 N terminal domain protein n=1 Tax=Aspergillus ambiguus TaxID=176160 RepID=UPI003CCCB68E